MMKKRGSYFFVLDALIGGSILLLSLVVIFSSYLNTPKLKQSYTLSDDIMTFMLNTKVEEYITTYSLKLIRNKNITNTKNTLFEQIAIFHYEEKNELATNYTRDIIQTVLPEQYGIMYSINESEIYNRSIDRYNKSRFLLSSRKMTFFKINQTSVYGPTITEVQIWA
ncbi:MAG: hypothetical protein ABIC91_04700 [Nanoarchaeota archaeon]|nr:hypothetical protein [Nanoarchaeota archaeon]MBU1030674.1 hypothetical protein [Nanoarchaeota archaeon]MBU1849333.1 hypothetical protein [Nanoarchaeota archaeon]